MTSDELKTIRVSLNLTQKELAERVELSANSIARFEMGSGKFPIPKWLVRELNHLTPARKKRR